MVDEVFHNKEKPDMKSLTKILVSFVMLLALAFACPAQTNENTGAPGPSASSTPATKGNLTPEKKTFLKNRIETDSDEYRSYARRWSFIYHFFLFGGIVCAALAAILAKATVLRERRKQDNLVAILAGLATVLPLISTGGDFSSKWQANRIAASDMANLQLEIEKQNADYDEIITRIQDINTSRNSTIAGKK